ncbi:hypothetical protein JW979_11090 [bacterium]|nr:hypothetical protein [candidate division CSSED10-310 bacterium]
MMGSIKTIFVTSLLVSGVLVPGAVFCSGSEPGGMTDDTRRLDNIALMAKVWREILIYHPDILRCESPIDWYQVLEDAIPAAEAVTTDAEMVNVLNDFIFTPLNDPFSYAELSGDETPEQPDETGTLEARKISDSTGYIDLTAASVLTDPNLMVAFNDAVAGLGDIEMLIVDFRINDPSLRGKLDESVLHFFLDKTVIGGTFLSRVLHGWSEHEMPTSYEEYWKITSGLAMNPINQPDLEMQWKYRTTPFSSLSPITVPTVLLINDVLLQRFDHIFDALQTRPHIAILREKSGKSWSTLRIDTDRIKVSINVTKFLSHTGEIGFHADLVSQDSIDPNSVPALAEKIFKDKSGKKPAVEPSSEFCICFQAPFKNKTELTREERIAGLIKLWTVISKFFPHLELTDIDPSSMLQEWIPQVESAQTLADYYDVIQRLTKRMNDSHVSVTHPDLCDNEFIIPVRLTYLENKVVIDKIIAPPESIDPPLQVGDEITHVNRKPIEEWLAYYKERLSSSTPQSFYRSFVYRLGRGGKDETVELTVKSNNEARQVALKRSLPRMAWYTDMGNQEFKKTIPGDLVYIDAMKIPFNADFESIFAECKDAEGMILDMRGYPQSNLHMELVTRLSDKPVTGTRFEVPMISPYLFEPVPTSYSRYYVLQPKGKHPFLKPVVVLINETLVSASEDVCIYLKNLDHITFVGSPTSGVNGNVTSVSLPGGGSMSFTGMRAKHADGSRFQNIGILPDVEVKPSLEGLREGKDEVLEKGIQVLKSLIKE